MAGQLALSKKQGVSGQSVSPALPSTTQKHSKDFRTKALIKEAIMDNDFLKNLSSSQVPPIAFLCFSIVLLGPFFAPASFFLVLSLPLVPFLASSRSFLPLTHQDSYVSFFMPGCSSFLSLFFLSPGTSLTFLSFIGFLSCPPLFLHGQRLSQKPLIRPGSSYSLSLLQHRSS